ncbi:MAG: PH domain-containing protein [Candidatus Thorarchaeota archaeon]
MGEHHDGKVIRPPMENITSGKLFKPSKRFLYKQWTQGILLALTFWFLAVFGTLGLIYLIAYMDEILVSEVEFWVNTWFMTMNIGVWIINLIWLIPAIIGSWFYVRSIEYSVIAESGETMPEVYVKKGIVNITKKHVMFRVITYISSKAGPFDRLFGIGTVEIQTAGFSGGTQTGTKPEEKIEGIPYFEGVRDFILRELRKYVTPYSTGTEISLTEDQIEPSNETIVLLREIRDLLREGR